MKDTGAMAWDDVLDSAGRWSALVHRGATADSVAKAAGGVAWLSAPVIEGVTAGGRWRFDKAVEVEIRAAHMLHELARAGCAAISALVMWSAMAQAGSALARRQRLDPLDEAAWDRWCAPMRNAAALVVVLDVPRWRVSRAVWADVVWALERNVPVHVVGAS